MTASEMLNLVQVGATDSLRRKLKKFGMKERMIHLQRCIPFIKDDKKYINFFRKNFSVELGALITAEGDIERAIELYKKAEK
jgi:prefoldin subunit 5